MWIQCRAGFLSVVTKTKKDVCVRARDANDLARFIVSYCKGLKVSDVINTPYGDYSHRVYMPKKDFAEAMSRIAEEIDYENVKDMIKEELSPKHHLCAFAIWSAIEYHFCGVEWWKNYRKKKA